MEKTEETQEKEEVKISEDKKEEIDMEGYPSKDYPVHLFDRSMRIIGWDQKKVANSVRVLLSVSL